MPAIDGLLALVEIQKASGLVLVTGEVPALLVGGATRPLSMPALAPALFDALIDELLDPEQRERLRAQDRRARLQVQPKQQVLQRHGAIDRRADGPPVRRG